MTISYELGDALYINLTNRCNCACKFCVRNSQNIFYDTLWLPREPSREEILSDILSHSPTSYSEIVFCGFGEPTYRMDDILWLCDKLHSQVDNLPPIRLNTNGLGSLIHNKDITPSFKGRIARVSISLNASNQKEYNHLVRPNDPENAWPAMLRFARDIKQYVPNVNFTIVDYDFTTKQIQACQIIADEIGIDLHIRGYSD